MSTQNHNLVRNSFAWLPLLGAYRIALTFRQMLLSLMAIALFGLLTATGINSLDHKTPEPSDQVDSNRVSSTSLGSRVAYWQSLGLIEPTATTSTTTPKLTEPNKPVAFSRVPFPTRNSLKTNPWIAVVDAGSKVIQPGTPWVDRGLHLLNFFILVAVWSVFGLAICRLAAVRFARDDAGSFRQSVQFAISRWRPALLAPTLPLGAAALIAVGLSIIAWPGKIAWVGDAYLMCISVPALISGLIIVLLLLATALGWPLMIAAIAVENCDEFGGLSRAHSLWTGRVLYSLWLLILATVCSSLLGLLVDTLFVWTRAVIANITTDQSAENGLSSAMRMLAKWLANALQISLFWTNSTIVYLFLREKVDAMPVNRIAATDNEVPPTNPFPVVGIPATDALQNREI